MESREQLEVLLAAVLREYPWHYKAVGPQQWFEKFGGPEELARLCVLLQDVLKDHATVVAQVRNAAILHMLDTRSVTDVARSLGVTKQAVSQAAKSPSVLFGPAGEVLR